MLLKRAYFNQLLILSQFELPNIVNLDNEIIESSKDKIIDNKRKL